MRVIDLEQLPTGHWYEDRYRGYIQIFDEIAHLPASERVTVRNAPWSWVPLLMHLNCDISSARNHFEHCPIVAGALQPIMNAHALLDRTMVDCLVSFRPETADCLWKVDMQWKNEIDPGRVRVYPAVKGDIIITTNGAYHRHEIIGYMDKLAEYKPTKKKCILVPCAADKPYPSPMHEAVLNMMPSDYYLMNATGVVGLVPQDLWPIMPKYDSGIPNQWRLYETIGWYFNEHKHDRVVVYCDFYSPTIVHAFIALEQEHIVEYAIEPKEYDDYLDLLDSRYLNQLRACLPG